MLLDMPPMPPETQAVIQQECSSIYSKMIRPASTRQMQSSEAKASGAESESTIADEFRSIRRNAIEQESYSIGAQAGLYWRYNGIVHILETSQMSTLLDQAFDFNRAMSGNNILLPVISEARESFVMTDDGQTARSSQRSWEIIENSRITTTVPTWREYLYQFTEAPNSAPSGLMPYNPTEQSIWQTGLCAGFQGGIDQANMIFGDRLTRLVRDYSGMLRFRMLAEQKIVSLPSVDEGYLGISVQSDKVHVDDRIIRITEPVRFNDPNQWQAVPGVTR